MTRVWILGLALLGLSSALICPDGGMCEDRDTCCKNSEESYACCPLSHAECCSDHLHCCYEGTVCDLEHARCVNKSVSLPWVKRFPAKQVQLDRELSEAVKAVICPDLQSECPDDATCCQLPDHSWGCCPLIKAVCCKDRLHCCPERTVCDLAHSRCTSVTGESVPLLKKFPAKTRRKNPASTVGSVMCPGGLSSCPEGYTCCQLPSGDYGCCPYPKATCCSDHLHCCPDNMQCDLQKLQCFSGDARISMLKKIPAMPSNSKCPDKKSSCPDQNTCCRMQNRTYGCCPMPDAVCCSDHIHCCPTGTECDLAHGACVSPDPMSPPASPGTQMSLLQTEVVKVHCDLRWSCSDGHSCCKTPEGDWSCCPISEAVCCEDHLHCCPHGSMCNLATSTCDDPSGVAIVPLLTGVPAHSLLEVNTRCNDTVSCPGKSSCCKTVTGSWACCPLHKAVCCEDFIHCCPHGTICNIQAQTCDDPTGVAESQVWATKFDGLTTEPDQDCDEQTRCRGGTTCCKGASGQWACCPLSQAVCCSDGEHCCPNGYKCNMEEKTCDKDGEVNFPWVRKTPALRRVSSLIAVSAPNSPRNMCDRQTSCPKETTCCFMARTQKWGCCPLPQAVCCEDGNHCCPRGHACLPHRSSCSKGPHTIPWFAKIAATTEPGDVSDVKCDDRTSCAAGTTCCRLQSGAWGCCPLVKAVCCADYQHCCPQGYSCNMQTGTCEKKTYHAGSHSLSMTKVLTNQDTFVPCDHSGNFHCPLQETCCQISDSEWKCCPSPKAVCCANSRSCCPAGFACDVEAGSCRQLTPRTWHFWFQDKKSNL
ncbi:granulin b [Neosynchiropus ocellatus]